MSESDTEKLNQLLTIVVSNRDFEQQRLRELKYSIDKIANKLDDLEDYVNKEVRICTESFNENLKDNYCNKDQIQLLLNDHADSVKESLLLEIKRYAVVTGTFLGVLAVAYTFVFGKEPVLQTGLNYKAYEQHQNISSKK